MRKRAKLELFTKPSTESGKRALKRSSIFLKFMCRVRGLSVEDSVQRGLGARRDGGRRRRARAAHQDGARR